MPWLHFLTIIVQAFIGGVLLVFLYSWFRHIKYDYDRKSRQFTEDDNDASAENDFFGDQENTEHGRRRHR